MSACYNNCQCRQSVLEPPSLDVHTNVYLHLNRLHLGQTTDVLIVVRWQQLLFALSQAWLYVLPFSQKMAVISIHWAGNCSANVPWRWKAICRCRKLVHEVGKVHLAFTSKPRHPECRCYSSSVRHLMQSVGHFKTINPCGSSPRTLLWLHKQQPSFFSFLWLSWDSWL